METIRPELHAYLAKAIRNHNCECFGIGSVEDHIHIAMRLHHTADMSSIMEKVKSSTSKWLKTKSPELAAFAWQSGYSAFSVNPDNLDALLKYINGQREHHKKVSFQDELRQFLKRYKMGYDEKYIWG